MHRFILLLILTGLFLATPSAAEDEYFLKVLDSLARSELQQSEEYLLTLSKPQLRLLRNTLYARHGYIFANSELDTFFRSRRWYKPNYDSKVRLTAGDKANIAVLKHYEAMPRAKELIVERFADNGDGTITDQKTGLMWMRCCVGKTWNGTTCSGDATEFPEFRDAQTAADGVSFAGHDDWRVPSIDELKSIVFCSSGNSVPYSRGERCEGLRISPTIHLQAFPDKQGSWHWSSTPYPDDPQRDWGVHLSYGGIQWAEGYARNNHVNLVRSPSE